MDRRDPPAHTQEDLVNWIRDNVKKALALVGGAGAVIGWVIKHLTCLTG